MNKKIVLIGEAIGIVGGFGASMLVGAAAGPIVAGAHGVSKVLMTLGVTGLGGLAADKTTTWFKDSIIAFGESVNGIKEMIKTCTEKSESENEPEEAGA